MAAKSLTVSGVVRDVLKSEIELPADAVIRRAKARGLKASDQSIRDAVHNLRSQMRKAAAAKAPAKPAILGPRPVPAAAKVTAATPAKSAPAKPAVPAPAKPPAATAPSIASVVRPLLKADVDAPSDAVIAAAKARGAAGTDKQIRKAVKKIRSELRVAARKSTTSSPSVAAAPAAAQRAAVPAPVPARPAPAGLAAVLGNVALVNKVVGAAGGPEPARQVAEAVRACGGVDQFLQHLDTVAGIRGGTAG